MTRILAALLLLAQALDVRALTPASERTFNLQDSMQLALLNNSDVLNQEQSMKIAEERVTEALFLFLPEFGVSANATRYDVDRIFALPPELGGTILSPNTLFPGIHNDIYAGRLFFTQTLYAGRRGMNTYTAAKVALQQAKLNYEASRMNVRTATTKVFFELLYAQKRVEATHKALEEAERRYPLEGLEPLSRVEAVGQLEGLRSLDASATRDLDSAKLSYLKTMGLELNTPVELEGDLSAKPVEPDLNKIMV